MTIDLLIEILVKSTLILLAGLLVRALVRKSNPSLRHLILFVTILGSIAVPIAVPLIKFQTKIDLPVDLKVFPDSARGGEVQLSQILDADSRPYQHKVEVIAWQDVLSIIWLSGFALVLIRYGIGLASLLSIRRRESFAKPQLKTTDTPRYELRISTCDSPKTPMTWGFIRPVVLLPQEANHWTSHRLEMILLHELAHVRRRDFVSQLLAELACAIYWFNPLVWHSAHAMRDDAELAADDAVLRTGIRPSDYATELLQIAANLSKKKFRLNRVGISTMTNSKIESRLTAILSSSTKTRGITTVSALVALSLSGIAVTAISSMKLHQNPTPAQLKAQSMSRLKQISLAAIIYAADYDDLLPNATSTKGAQTVLSPYIKDNESFKCSRPGASFTFNLNVSEVNISTLKTPAETVLWYEVTPKGMEPNAAYVDGHTRTITKDLTEDFEKALKQKYRRGGTAIPPSSGIGR